jgi:hypothetical protein
MKKRVKTFIAVITVMTVLCIGGCGKKEENTENKETLATSTELAVALAEKYAVYDNMVIGSYGEDYFQNYVDKQYGYSGDLEDGCVIYAYDGLAAEVAVLKTGDGENMADKKDVKEALQEHVSDRTGVYTGYFPDEVEKLGESVVFTYEEFVVLVVPYDGESMDKEAKVKDVFADICGYDQEELSELSQKNADRLEELYDTRAQVDEKNNTEDTESAEGTDESTEEGTTEEVKITDESQLTDIDDSTYYNQDIVTAYLNGDEALLTDEKDIAIYNEVKRIIDENISDSMTDVEKEKAIHDYMCINMDYDENAIDIEENAMEDSDNPYGMLINHFGICSGYSSTFKLFMDCLQIPCMIVEGKANSLADDHAWNKVKIDDIWYNVDVTWDDPVYTGANGEIDEWYENYTFFNCSDVTLEMYDHQWNHDLYPESKYSMDY